MLDKIRNDIKQAMKDKDNVKKTALKNVMNKALDTVKKRDINGQPTSDDIMDSIRKEIKQLDDTLKQVPESSELYNISLQQRNILQNYLPKQLSYEETLEKVRAIAVRVAMNESLQKGNLMKACISNLKDVADGKIISMCVDTVLKELKK